MLTCFDLSKIPRPKLSTPALLETTVNSLTLALAKAFIRFSGIPHKPKPPTNKVDLDGMSLIASSALLNISTNCGLSLTSIGEPSKCNRFVLFMIYFNY